MTNKTPNNWIRLNKVYKYRLPNFDGNVKLLFLDQFLDWLNRWKNMNGDTGVVTKETHNALKHRTYVVIEIVSYYQAELGLAYMLPEKCFSLNMRKHFYR